MATVRVTGAERVIEDDKVTQPWQYAQRLRHSVHNS